MAENQEKQDVKERIEPISLLKHTVNVPSPYLLQFFYPDLSIVNSLEEYEPGMNNIIYDGNYKLVAKFNQLGINYIATKTPVFEYDLTDKNELIKFVYSKYRKNPPSYLQNQSIVESMSYEDCLTYCKMFWVSGIWYGVKEENAKKTFDFYLSMCNDAYLTVLKKFYELDFDISLSLLSFLFNIAIKGDTKDGRYKELLVRANGQFGNRIKLAVNNYLNSNITDKKLRCFYLLFDIYNPQAQ